MGLEMKVLAKKKRLVPASIAREMFARLKMASSKKPSRAASCSANIVLAEDTIAAYCITGCLMHCATVHKSCVWCDELNCRYSSRCMY